MKKLFFICVCFLFAITNCETLKEDEIIARKIMYRVSDVLESRYQLRYGGYSEAGDKTGYTEMGLFFNKFGKVSKDEGRKMMVDCVNEFLKEINSDPKMQPFLITKPFTALNVQIMIIVYSSDGRTIFYPDINVFSAARGKINYYTSSPDQKFGHFTEEEEPFEEAVQIVEAQDKENKSLQ
jgi:hypothetical protein